MNQATRLTPPFRYLADPVCVAGALLCVLNRFVLRPHDLGGSFVACYLNDVLCLPLFVPVSLYAQRLLRVRRHDAPPLAWEIAQHAVVFSIVFELIIPRLGDTFRSTADPLDALAYVAGGIVAGITWTMIYGRRQRSVPNNITALPAEDACAAGLAPP